MGNINSIIRKKGAVTGIYLGLVLLLLNLALYYYTTRLTESFFMIAIGSNIIILILEIGATVWLCNTLRNKVGGYWTFKQAVTGIFMMFVVAYAIQIAGYDNLFAKVIDKNVSTNIHNAWVNANLKALKKGEDPKIVKHRGEVIDSNYNNQQKSGTINLSYIIQNILITIILGFVISLIFAALFKRDPPSQVISSPGR
ncbi:MAG: hypothetical protein JWR54_3163 [Mucilaginibacter sp.]|nr:hypothetical protein [Mucilaginibacter sp.]